MIRRRIVLGAVLVVLFGLGWVAGRGSARAGDLYQNLDLFVEILHRIEQNYVDAVEPQKLVTGALRGMLRDLDPYSQYLDTRSYQNLQAMTHGSFGGVGVEVSIRDNHPTVISPIEGGPAWTLGVRSGDVITRIDGQRTAGLTIDEVATRLRGPEGTHVQISIWAPAVSAQNPPTGCSLVIRIPMVLTMRHPPARVPRPMAAWAARTTQKGT